MTNTELISITQESETSSSSSDNSSNSSGSEELEIPMQGRDLFVKCVHLPDFLLTHAEYGSI